MRPTLRVRYPWREVSSRLARYRASHGRLAEHHPGDRGSPPGPVLAGAPCDADDEPERDMWSPELASALQTMEQGGSSEVVEKWLPQLPRPDGESAVRFVPRATSVALTLAPGTVLQSAPSCCEERSTRALRVNARGCSTYAPALLRRPI